MTDIVFDSKQNTFLLPDEVKNKFNLAQDLEITAIPF
jgi:hypothetical protein